MSSTVIVVHGFGPKKHDSFLINNLQRNNYDVIYYDWFNWSQQFDINIFEKQLQKDLLNNNVSGIIGISVGGFIIGKYTNLITGIPIIFLSSSPKFNPNFLVNLIFKSKFICKSLNSINKLVLLPKTENNIVNIMKFTKNFDYSYLEDLRKFLISTDNRELINKSSNKITVINGENDIIMPPSSWIRIKEIKQYVVKNSHHANTLNSNSINYILKALKD